MTKPNKGAKRIGYRLLSVGPELLQKFGQEEEEETAYLEVKMPYKPFKISSSQKNDTDLLGLGRTLAQLPRTSPMHGSCTGLISADEPQWLKESR